MTMAIHIMGSLKGLLSISGILLKSALREAERSIENMSGENTLAQEAEGSAKAERRQ